jgi:hypothetical protein
VQIFDSIDFPYFSIIHLDAFCFSFYSLSIIKDLISLCFISHVYNFLLSQSLLLQQFIIFIIFIWFLFLYYFNFLFNIIHPLIQSSLSSNWKYRLYYFFIVINIVNSFYEDFFWDCFLWFDYFLSFHILFYLFTFFSDF